MAMPSKEAYLAAVQNPKNFGLPILKNAKIARDPVTHEPLCWPGAFGIIFRMMTSSETSRAIKCFTYNHKTRSERYYAVSEYLDRLMSRGTDSSRFLIDYYYVRNGIYTDSRWQPLLMMGWVEGETLNKYVGRLCGQPDSREPLLELARTWAELALALRKDNLVHGDLQHNNIFVQSDGQLKLIDYDGMCVPALASKYVMEGGHPNYQHPRRSVHYCDRLDCFSELVILTALVVLAVRPDLWAKYDHGRNMLFQASDFKAPRDSALFKELEVIEEPNARRMVNELRLACMADSVESIPALETTIPLLNL